MAVYALDPHARVIVHRFHLEQARWLIRMKIQASDIVEVSFFHGIDAMRQETAREGKEYAFNRGRVFEVHLPSAPWGYWIVRAEALTDQKTTLHIAGEAEREE